jgi:sugar phosphate isomerase/epimerase
MKGKFKIALSSMNFTRAHFIDYAIKKTAELGYEGVEFMANRPYFDPEECTQKDIEKVRKLLEECKLPCVSVTTNDGSFHWCLSSVHEVVRKATINHVKAAIELAHELGAGIVESESGPGRIVEDDPVEEWKRTKDSYTELAEHAAKFDVVIGQEASRNPLVRESHVTETLKDSIQLVREIGSKNLGVLIDTAHAAQEPFMAIPEALELAKPYLVHVHTSDSPLTHHEHLPFGQGKVNWDAVVDTLKRIGYDKWVTVELGFCPDPIGEVSKALRVLKQYRDAD